MRMDRHITLILHNLRSAHNVGALFRSADAFGVSKIYCTGHTPTPVDTFGRPRADIAKTALGAQETLSWEYAPTLAEVVELLRAQGMTIIGLEQDEYARSLSDAAVSAACALVVGNEVAGLTTAERELCDTLVEIPMRGKKESLNVAVAGSIALYTLST